MKTDLFRTRQILTKDRMSNISTLPDLISAEIGDVLSHILDIKTCNTKVNVLRNGDLDILVVIKSGGLKNAEVL